MKDAATTDALSYRFIVSDVFRFGDGRTVFLGQPDPPMIHLTPAVAEVEMNGEIIGCANLIEERMPGPASKGRRALVTRGAVDIDQIKAGACVLKCLMMR